MLKIVLMGLLMKGDNHGYNLRKIVEEDLIDLVDVDNSSIYYTLTILEKDGFLTHKRVSDSSRPQKNLYSLTEKGREEFKRLLLANMGHNMRPLLNIDVSLYFINMLNRAEALEGLDERLKHLRKLTYLLKSQERRFREADPVGKEALIFSHNRRLAEAEMGFLKDLMEDLGGELE